MFTVYLIKVVWELEVETLAFALALIKCLLGCQMFRETLLRNLYTYLINLNFWLWLKNIKIVYRKQTKN